MNASIYQASLYCDDCIAEVKTKLLDEGATAPEDRDDEETYDSDEWPKGPYPDAGGEADTPQHCEGCGVFLENDLTVEGARYVQEAAEEWIADIISQHDKAVKEWMEFYGYRVIVAIGG